MRTPDTLKQLLIQIRSDGYRLSDTLDINDILTDMLKFIGHTDSELRERLIYCTFCKWSEEGVITENQMKRLLEVCLDEQHLFYGIGEVDTDSVFTRAFSVLMIPLALSMDRKDAFLTQSDVLNVKEKIIDYLKKERDFRGHVSGKGWAHAIAHAADAIDDIAKSSCIKRKDLIELLETVKLTASNSESVYACEEDERLVTALIAILDREVLSDKEILDWLNSFKSLSKDESMPGDVYARVNRRCFLRGVYFRLLPMNNGVITQGIQESCAM